MPPEAVGLFQAASTQVHPNRGRSHARVHWVAPDYEDWEMSWLVNQQAQKQHTEVYHPPAGETTLRRGENFGIRAAHLVK